MAVQQGPASAAAPLLLYAPRQGNMPQTRYYYLQFIHTVPHATKRCARRRCAPSRLCARRFVMRHSARYGAALQRVRRHCAQRYTYAATSRLLWALLMARCRRLRAVAPRRWFALRCAAGERWRLQRRYAYSAASRMVRADGVRASGSVAAGERQTTARALRAQHDMRAMLLRKGAIRWRAERGYAAAPAHTAARARYGRRCHAAARMRRYAPRARRCQPRRCASARRQRERARATYCYMMI